jgi:hypothetical protein
MKINFFVKERIVDKLFYFQKKNWIITVLIFLVVFVSAVIIWRDCILEPQPSESTLSNILKIEQEYKTKMHSIEKNHESLEEQTVRFNNPKESSEERSYFESPGQVVSTGPSYTPDAKNFNPQLID